MVLHLWGSNSGPPMFAVHFGFGIGGILAPQIARPFISDQTYNNVSNSPLDTLSNSYHYETKRTHNHSTALFIPFLIIGLVTIIIGISMLVIFKIGPPEGYPKRKSAKNIKQLFSPKSCAKHAPWLGILILCLLFLYFLNSVGGENVYPTYIYSFCIESDLGITEGQATVITSLFWFGHLTGRASSTVISKFVPISILIVVDMGLLLLVTIILSVTVHPMILWILTPVLGFLVSPLFPAGLSWSNKFLKANSMSVMVCLLGCGVGAMIYVYFTGYLFEHTGPGSLMYVEVFHASILLCIFGAMEFTGRKYLKKVKDKEKTDVDGIAEEELKKKDGGDVDTCDS